MTSLKKDIENALVAQISTALAPRGFKFVKADRAWRRKEPNKTLSFHLSVIHHPGDFDVTIDVAVRLETLAALLEEVLGGVNAARQIVGGFTVGAEIGNLTIGRPRRWTLASQQDAHDVATSILETFDATAQPYYREFSDPERLLAVLSGDSRDSSKHAAFDHFRAIQAVALAFVLGRRDEFDKLVQYKRQVLLASPDVNARLNLPHFEKVVRELEGRWDPGAELEKRG